MIVRLHPNLGIDSLAEQLALPNSVMALDLTNCIFLCSDQLMPQIRKCTSLECLRCVACPLRPSDLLMLMLKWLPHLLELEFSLMYEKDADKELEHMQAIESQEDSSARIPVVRRIYVEVWEDQNFQLLSKLLRYCTKLEYLHMHCVRGTFRNALLECHAILQKLDYLKMSTFTSEIPSCYQQGLRPPLGFTTCASVCANVSYHQSGDSWSCVPLRNLADDRRAPCTLPCRLIVVAVDFDMTAQWISVATQRNIWLRVHHLCLLLLPEDASSDVYPTAGGTYRDSLRYFFEKALKHITELNISFFHFGHDLNVDDLLQKGSLHFLQSLSMSPCGLRSPSALRRLAQHCAALKDLDVRFERKGRIVHCAGCEDGIPLPPEEVIESTNGSTTVFGNGLVKMTLNDLHVSSYQLFIDTCCPTTALRLFKCPTPSDVNHERLCQVLASTLRCLVLQHEHLQFDDEALRAKLSRVNSLEYLYLLSAVPLSDDVAVASVYALSASLPRLLFLHVHYRSASHDGRVWRITWMTACIPGSRGVVHPNGPCFPCCSAATFIGLDKPRNREFDENF